MGRLEFYPADQEPFRTVEEIAVSIGADANVERLSEAERLTEVRYFRAGDADSLQCFEVRCEAGSRTEPHAHETDELIYVLEGELVAGARRLGVGSALFVPARTLYSFTAGSNGLRFLNFRPSRDDSYISRSVLAASRAADRDV